MQAEGATVLALDGGGDCTLDDVRAALAAAAAASSAAANGEKEATSVPEQRHSICIVVGAEHK